jgi:hypothetical protein
MACSALGTMHRRDQDFLRLRCLFAAEHRALTIAPMATVILSH